MIEMDDDDSDDVAETAEKVEIIASNSCACMYMSTYIRMFIFSLYFAVGKA